MGLRLMKYAAGFSMIEVLVTIVILLVGLLGLAALHGRANTAEMESYQRSQALILLSDMMNRINANRKFTMDYVDGSAPYVGGTGNLTDCAGLTGVTLDLCQWGNMLEGAAESNAGANIGAMIGARGCITYDAGTDAYTVSVAWQGLVQTAAPADVCGKGQYDNGKDENKNGEDDGDEHRRVVSATLRIADLS